MPFRFVHTADLHLDSPLASLALRDPALAEIVGTATRTALERIVGHCLSEEAHALVIAGDLYDGTQTSMKTAGFLASQLGRLHAAGIATFIVRGNHDAMSRITKELVLPPSVHVFGARPGTVEIEAGGLTVALHGLSFRETQAPESLLHRYPAPVAGAVNVGILHTSLDGAAGHDVYAPASLAELRAVAYDYWALGHIHKRAEHPGRPHVVMPGNPQGRDIGEAGRRSATLVEIAPGGAVTTRELETAVAEFARLDVDAREAEDWAGLVGTMRTALEGARRAHDGEHLIVRPRILAAPALQWRLRRDDDLLAGEARQVAEGIGSLWIDKVEIAGGAAARPAEGPLAELAAGIADGPLPDAVKMEARSAADALIRALPGELREFLGESEEAEAEARETLLRQGALDLLSRLSSGEET